MTLHDSDLDWCAWFERWQAQQDCYVPRRQYRFDLMLQWPGFARNAELHILNVGCGPGSLAFHALDWYPKAQVVAVDQDPVLLAIGQQVARSKTGDIQFLQADIRELDWWAAQDGVFDLVISANALHWLSAESLSTTYRRIFAALKPGGWLMNSDHVAGDCADTQARYREMLRAKQETAFRESGADNWDAFWSGLGRELGQPVLWGLRNEAEYWEGSEDGYSKQYHVEMLRGCGFEQVEFHWQDLGEAVLGARKPRD